MIDRKRKFVDTDLAHDSEGSGWRFPHALWLPQITQITDVQTAGEAQEMDPF